MAGAATTLLQKSSPAANPMFREVRNSQMLCTPIRLGGDLLTGLLFGLDSVFELHTVQELGDLLGTA